MTSKSHNTKSTFVLRTLSEFRRAGGPRIAELADLGGLSGPKTLVRD